MYSDILRYGKTIDGKLELIAGLHNDRGIARLVVYYIECSTVFPQNIDYK